VVDILRDYRFYDVDLVHPNYAATTFVIDHFMKTCLSPKAQDLAEQIKKIQRAYRHRPQHANSPSHHEFLTQFSEKAETLQKNYPFLDFSDELKHFKAKY
jgi:hypothetical protein